MLRNITFIAIEYKRYFKNSRIIGEFIIDEKAYEIKEVYLSQKQIKVIKGDLTPRNGPTIFLHGDKNKVSRGIVDYSPGIDDIAIRFYDSSGNLIEYINAYISDVNLE